MQLSKLRVGVWSRVLIAAVLLTVAVSSATAGTWVAVTPEGKVGLQPAGTSQAPQVDVNWYDSSGLSVTVELTGLEFTGEKTKGGGFVNIGWPMSPYAGQIGKPAIPVVRHFVVAPAEAQVSVSVDAGTGVLIGSDEIGFQLRAKPVQAPIEKIPGAIEAAPFDFDADAYATDVTLPTERVSIHEVGSVRGQRLFLLEVRPVSYNPVTEQVTVWPRMSAEVEFKGGIAPSYEVIPSQQVQKIVLNPDTDAPVSSRSDNYLIIVADVFEADIASFASFKTGQGYNVTVNAVSSGTSAAAIKTYIQGLYGGANSPDYILLVGDTNTIPSWTGGGTGSPDTDLPYGCMDSDYLPEIPFGRFPVRTTGQLEAIVTKTIDLESGNWADPEYAERACFMASVDNYEISEGTHNYVIGTHLTAAGITCDKLYQVTYGADTQDVRDSFNGGRVYGIYSGHGGSTSWADGPPFSQSDVNNLTNYQMYPFVCSFACVTGDYENYDECFVETWIRAPGKGAATMYGSSVNSYWTEDDILERVLFDFIYDDPPTREVSPAWQGGMLLYMAHFGDSGTTRRYFEMYNLMGDPSLYLPEPGGGADLRVMPSGGLETEGMSGGPFDPDNKVYMLGNNSAAPISFEVSADQSWVDIDVPSGTIPVGGEVPVTVSLGTEAYTFGQGHYEATVDFVNTTTHDGDTTRGVVLDVGRTIIDVTPSYGLETGGPLGGPFTGTVTYTITSERPTPVDVQIVASDSWISLNGGAGPVNLTLTGTGDSANVVVGISDEADSLGIGVYNGSVSITNLTSGEGDAMRDVYLEVGRVLYVSTDVPKPINDNSTITSVIEVTDAYCVGDVNVEIDITHTYIGDLTVDLQSPSGVVVRLHDRSGSSSDDIVTTYDEQDGTMPDGPGSLADFNYMGVTGTWTLTVEDHAIGDTGSLNHWALRIVPLGDTCPPIANDVDVAVTEIVPSDIVLDGESISGETLDYIITSLPDHGVLSDPNGGPIGAVPYMLAAHGDTVVYDPTGLYVGPDAFNYKVNDGLDSDEATVSVMVGGPQVVYDFPMDVDPLWKTEASWAFGQPTGGGGQYGNPDPTSGFTGTNVYGYNLNGDYENSMSEQHLTTLALDCSELSDVSVVFRRWLGVEQPSYDHAYFRVSKDGMVWTDVWTNTESVTDSSWTYQEFDISEIADGEQTLYLRWTMGTTDSSWQYCGWNIDDVEIWAVAPIVVECPWDFNENDIVDPVDVGIVKQYYGCPVGTGDPLCDQADVSGNGAVDPVDVGIVKDHYGPCP